MEKKSVGDRLSANPVRISLIDKEDRRRTQSLKSRAAASEETHIPRPRFRSSSTDVQGRKSSLKPPARIQSSQHGYGTPQPNAVTPNTSRSSSAVRSLHPPSGSTVRGRSPSAERASNIGLKISCKDNRPLTDRAFQAEMLGKIDSYFRSIEQTSLLNNNGSLKPVTLKIFVQVTDLLAKLLDVKHALTIANYVEELPKIAKKLHYPGQITKSWLKTANAMHSWPQVLGWVSWLVECCVVKDLAADHFQLDNLPFLEADTGAKFNKMKFQFLLNAYKAWNEEKPNEEAALTEEFLQKVANSQGVTETDIENAVAESKSEATKLEDAKATGQALDEELRQLEEELRALRNEEAMQDTRIREQQSAEKKYLTEAEQLREESKILCKTLQQQKLRQEELREQINSQPMSAVQRDDIVERCLIMRNQLLEFDKHLNDLEKEIYTLDIKLASSRNILTKAVFSYNKDIYLQLIKESDLDLDDFAMPVTGILNPKIMDELNRKATLMSSLHENIKERLKKTESIIERDEKMLDSLIEEKAALDEKKQNRLAKVNECKRSVKAIKAAAKAEEIELKESIENLNHNIKEILNKMPNAELEERELEEAREKLEALSRRKAYLEESAHLFFEQFYETLANHRTKLAALLTEGSDLQNSEDHSPE
ncbi:kinetochore protein NDC80 homolog [Neodiprion fabricii]|uniref:kinetochore protein NDC80 homolog n=1 Tax=Neodiprion fabricii TaxID=2872261 RepID=UPI001ED8FB96|nr:kinetochore protein NDC80 homolog [Neodiprion fabricii]